MKAPPKSINYQDIIVRVMSPKDGDAIFMAVKTSLPELRTYMNWAHYITDLQSALEIYADFETKALRGKEVNFCAFDQKNGDLLFCAGLSPGSRLNPAALDLGYWVSTKYANQGFGTLAAKIMIVLAFTYFKADRLSVTSNPENAASLRIIEKTGFAFEGKLRNFLPAPTEQMIANDYSPIQEAHCFSLLPKEAEELSWFFPLQKELLIIP